VSIAEEVNVFHGLSSGLSRSFNIGSQCAHGGSPFGSKS
jgi:hypothetical protein